MPGELAGSAISTSRSASVPPVDAPMHTTISVVLLIARPEGGISMASAVSFASTLRGAGAGLCPVTRALAAPLTVSRIIIRDSAR